MNLSASPPPPPTTTTKKPLKWSQARNLRHYCHSFWIVVNFSPWRGFNPAIKHSKQAGEHRHINTGSLGLGRQPFGRGLALGQRGDGWVTGLRALREGGSQPTPEHTPADRRGSPQGALPGPYPSQQGSVWIRASLQLWNRKSARLRVKDIKRHLFNHIHSDTFPQIITATISWGLL